MEIEICRVPKILELEYREEQKLNKAIMIENLIDQVVEYKIKSNRPELYIVKPMEGSIYKKETTKITFIRKALPREEFESYLHSPNPPQEKFLINMTYNKIDAVGRENSIVQSAYMAVRFHAELRGSEEILLSPSSVPSGRKST